MNSTINEAGIGLMAIVLILILPIIALASLVELMHTILSNPGHWRGTAKEVAITFIRRSATLIAIVVPLGIAWGYWKDAQLRAICEPKERNSEQSPDGSYWARYCYFGGTVILRLYDKEGKRLLAERTYRDTSGIPVNLHWAKETLMYPEGQDLGTINLPPTLYDRSMARLP
ncbi:hypothetical protein [Burkholderia ubonensis]|uniref:hypothetical protein n=1 Tax=Burkholderia ubonensis TaxID=101571 RepID=UPI0012BA5A6E|nr:hypothetical protein [Burkholderia ubonensis]